MREATVSLSRNFARLTFVLPYYFAKSKNNSKYYSHQSLRYSSSSNTQKQLMTFPDKLIDFLEELNFEAILDVGCGEGLELDYLSKKTGAKCLGIEPNKSAVKKLKGKYNNDSNLNFKRSSASNLCLHDKSADLVILSSVLHWIEPSDYMPAISEACRVSKRCLLIVDFFSFTPVRTPNIHHRDKFTYRRDFESVVRSTGDFEGIFECYFHKSIDGKRWHVLSEAELQKIEKGSMDFELRRAVLFQRVEMQIVTHSFVDYLEN